MNNLENNLGENQPIAEVVVAKEKERPAAVIGRAALEISNGNVGYLNMMWEKVVEAALELGQLRDTITLLSAMVDGVTGGGTGELSRAVRNGLKAYSPGN